MWKSQYFSTYSLSFHIVRYRIYLFGEFLRSLSTIHSSTTDYGRDFFTFALAHILVHIIRERICDVRQFLSCGYMLDLIRTFLRTTARWGKGKAAKNMKNYGRWRDEWMNCGSFKKYFNINERFVHSWHKTNSKVPFHNSR
jgi:hypothetical protein